MSFEYHSVEVYRAKYKILAKFYTNKKGQESRLFADVVDREHEDALIDAYLVMINPGSCKKKSDVISESPYYKNLDVVEAKSDPAQKCVMAFMDLCGLKKVRILNLLDYKNGNYSKALKKVAEQNLADSLFSPERTEERNLVMTEKAPIIVAWGTDKRLADFKKQALECLEVENIIGVKPKTKAEYYDFAYIKPWTKDAQIQRILDLAECFREYTSCGQDSQY